MARRNCQRGFTLVELIMVIVIMGVIGGMVSVFMKSPIDAYFDTARRAGIADVADTTVRRMARDIRKALPNSIRTSADKKCIEFIPTRTGGRYRTQDIVASPSDNTSLRFDAPDDSFNMLGLNSALPADQQIKPNDNDLLVVYNLGIPGSDAYAGDNRALITGVNVSAFAANETELKMVGNTIKFPLESGTNRFHVIPGDEIVVSYICSGGTLYRNANYGYGASCPAPTVGTTPIIANGATCSFAYSAADIRNGLVQLTLTFTNSGETVSIYNEVHVNNTP